VTDERKRPGAGVWAASIVVGVILLPAVYLLLLGPLYFLKMGGVITADTWYIAVVPVHFWLNHIGTEPGWFWRAYEFGYVGWWGSLARATP
jgi:hypothetical protein